VNILLVRNDRLGDLVCALPLARGLKQVLPQARIGVLASPYAAPLLETHPDVDAAVMDGPGALEALRQGAWDAALCLYATGRNANLIRRAGIPIRLGADGRLASLLFTHRVALRRSQGIRHESEYNSDLGQALLDALKTGLKMPDPVPAPRLGLSGQDHAAAAEVLQRLGLGNAKGPRVLIHPGMGGSALNWPMQNYAQLADQLSVQQGAQVLFTGGASELEALKGLAVAQAHPAKVLDGPLPLRAFAALIAQASLFVSGSTGPMHIAGALGVPTLSFFPPIVPMSPLRWAPRGNRRQVLTPSGLGISCKKCLGEECPMWDCMAQISVKEAVSAAETLLP
jgi:ADP-heptose:LPS heptosyltransferase